MAADVLRPKMPNSKIVLAFMCRDLEVQIYASAVVVPLKDCSSTIRKYSASQVWTDDKLAHLDRHATRETSIV